MCYRKHTVKQINYKLQYKMGRLKIIVKFESIAYFEHQRLEARAERS